MVVGNGSRTATERGYSYKMRMYIAAWVQSISATTDAENGAYISVRAAWVTAVGHFDGKLYSQRRVHDTKDEDLQVEAHISLPGWLDFSICLETPHTHSLPWRYCLDVIRYLCVGLGALAQPRCGLELPSTSLINMVEPHDRNAS